ncbi:SAF domain-containing protein [Nocardiopsis dassonvillei]|uniref:SAF domain-containing protein n=1 Tax=Nocardiopsis dassonvillei TaxID=2014 RepID=UPI0020A35815|nr:SAF domain-containing protein [Nocardiopsis dassonvillei]MCP3017096.1 SAF domain-containing protein [Nocardiopsis dassonvillei]
MVDTKTAPAPAASPRQGETPPVRLLGSGPRRWRWLVLALGMMTAGGLSGVVALEQTDDRQGVLVADTDLPAGHVVTAEDLRVARISVADGVSFVGADRLEATVGQTLTVPVTEGGLLPEAALGAEATFPERDRAVLGVALRLGRFPASIGPGAAVSVVVHPEDGATGGGVEAYRALVRDVQPSAAEDGSVQLELVASSADAAAIASAAAVERVSVVQVNPRGGA